MNTGVYQIRNVVLIVASVIIFQVSSTHYVHTQELGAINQIEGQFMTGLESRLRGNNLFNNQLEQAILAERVGANVVSSGSIYPRGEIAREIIEREVENKIVRENQKEQLVKEIVQERVMESMLPIEEAAREARSIIRGQTYGQLSTFLNGSTAFNQSLIGTPVSSVEMFVEDCGMGNGDLLVVGSELSARNLQNEFSKATLLVQGKMLERMSPRMQQYAMEMQSIQQPLVHKVEVILVGHMQKIDMLSEGFSTVRQCIQRVHPEIEMLEKVMPQSVGIWRFKVDSGVHMIDHMHKFIGWIPLEKYQGAIIGEIEGVHMGSKYFPSQLSQQIESKFFPSELSQQIESKFFPSELRQQIESKYFPSELRQQMEYPVHFVNSNVEREMLSGLNTIELENLYNKNTPTWFHQTGYGMSPLAKKIWQLKNLRQLVHSNTQTPQYLNQYSNGYSNQYSNQYSNGYSNGYSSQYSNQFPTQFSGLSRPSVVVSSPRENVDVNMISTL